MTHIELTIGSKKQGFPIQGMLYYQMNDGCNIQYVGDETKFWSVTEPYSEVKAKIEAVNRRRERLEVASAAFSALLASSGSVFSSKEFVNSAEKYANMILTAIDKEGGAE